MSTFEQFFFCGKTTHSGKTENRLSECLSGKSGWESDYRVNMITDKYRQTF